MPASRPDPVIVAEGLFRVFGHRPERALRRLERGEKKEQILRETGATVAVQNANFTIQSGEIFVVMGLSGCGKSTLLRLVNRLIEPTRGSVHVLGQDVTHMNERELVALRRRHLGMVFQHFALLPHLNVVDNAAFGLEVAGVTKDERRERALSTLDAVGLRSFAERFPDELSGGMQQRVGLARALTVNPSILLMDEAFSALDPLIRDEMQQELMALQRERGITVMFVSHDINEATRVGDRIAIMNGGRIVQIDTPQAIREAPADDYVASFFSTPQERAARTEGRLS